jgi:hypothetical protein
MQLEMCIQEAHILQRVLFAWENIKYFFGFKQELQIFIHSFGCFEIHQ